ncbi:hypothetical protein FKG94_18485 [Exilibacterium tricleocarpae]|uniref:ABM domain-containing protein n=1 Tax=Exilibacterium tricleocarpae TaxID=2591008 RepID=A0A545T612_9GAMM|nr:antibiotic biosynthesis monooxygenase family protein [Exilibacterium tricleocarpae]TQV72677.1 hypothetical protein FKG94_18485 [Exilibacterium tricleocarpae]
MSKAIVSIYTFHLRPGSRVEDFIAASAAVQKFLEQQEGFQYRSLGRQLDNPSVWVDVVYWRDGAATQIADSAFMENPACQTYMNLLDESTVINRKCEVELASCSAGIPAGAASAA